jgi:ferrous iron transport protein A
MPLSNLSAGQQALIESLHGGPRVVSRLAILGFIPGQTIDMVQNFGRGPLIVSVRGTRIALGRGEAKKIVVRPSEGRA